jgi:hypothetical protein
MCWALVRLRSMRTELAATQRAAQQALPPDHGAQQRTASREATQEGAVLPTDILGELERVKAFRDTRRKEHRKQLDEEWQSGKITRDQHQRGLDLLKEVQPSWSRRILLEKIPDLLADKIFVAFLTIFAGVSIEAYVLTAVRHGISFGALFIFCLPLTLAFAAIAVIAEEAEDLIAVSIWGSIILFVAGVVQTLIASLIHPSHLVFYASLCSPSADPNNNCGFDTWAWEFIYAYWRAVGLAVLLSCAITGVLLGVSINHPDLARTPWKYVRRLRKPAG